MKSVRRLLLPSLVSSAAGLAAVFASSTSFAQPVATNGGALNRYEPAERSSEWFANDSLDFRGKLRPSFGLTLDYAYKPYTILNPDDSVRSDVVFSTLYLHAGGSLVLFDRFRIGASLPIAMAQTGDSAVVGGRSYIAPDSAALGDLRLAGDVRLLGEYGDAFTLAAGLRGWLPTGDQNQYAGDGSGRFGGQAMAAGDIGAFVYGVNAGVVYRANDASFTGHPRGSEMNFGVAAGARVLDKKLVIGPEIWGSTGISSSDAFFHKRTTPMGLMIGAHYTVSDFRFGLGGGPGLSPAAGTAAFRGLFSVDFIPAIAEKAPADRDGDGIDDAHDACPDTKGVATNDPSTNGCPAVVADRDKDGVADAKDACPDTPGVVTSDPLTNGCPPDQDKDGILDKDDACPTVAGVTTGDPATNGCPPDKDKDGIADKDDACIDVPGVRTDDPKTNGCPPDKDKDGINDPDDACPDAPGPKDPDPKKNGCPTVRIEAGQVKIREQIKFKTGSAVILKESQPIIDAVAGVMKDHPELKKVRVEGHTDNKGNAAFNKKLSASRAASVVAALIKAGVTKDRLSPEGFGQERPLESNDTEEGRAANRRVEFHIEGGAATP